MKTPTKRCSICRKELPLTPECFYRSKKSRDGFKADCKDCHAETRRSYVSRQRQPINDDCVRCELCGGVFTSRIQPAHLSAKHGITMAEYRAMGHPVTSPNLRSKITLHNQIAEIKRNYGPDHPNYKGGHISSNGYRVISRLGHKNLYEHRVIAEQKIGRPLTSDDIVHHIDGNRLNNHPDNLQVMTISEHSHLENRKGGGRRYHNIAPETIEACKALYELGWNKATIARALRVDPHAVSSWITELLGNC